MALGSGWLYFLFPVLVGCEFLSSEGPVNTTIRFPSTPGNYPGNTFLTWNLDFITLMELLVNVTELALEESNGCKADSLWIFNPDNRDTDSRLFCGQGGSSQGERVFTLRTFSVGIQFLSDLSVEDLGFSIHVTGSPVDAENICAMMHDRNRSQISTTLSDINTKYPPLLNCSWPLAASPGYGLLMEFTRFDIEYSGPDCIYDRVEIWSKSEKNNSSRQLQATFCGRRAPWTLHTYSAASIIRFITDSVDNTEGFRVEYRPVKLSAASRELDVLHATPRSVHTTLSTGLSVKDSVAGWRIQTHPGYYIRLGLDDKTRGFLKLCNGPFPTSVVIPPNNRDLFALYLSYGYRYHVPVDIYSSSGFLMWLSAEPHRQFNFTYIAVDYFSAHTIDEIGIYFSDVNLVSIQHLELTYFRITSNDQPQFALNRLSKRMGRLPNTDGCLYSGLALYQSTVSFEGLIGPLCDISPGYTANFLKKFIASGAALHVIVYDYSQNPKANLRHWDFLGFEPASSKCRGYQVSELMFRTGNSTTVDKLHLDVQTTIDSRIVRIVYEESTKDCFIIQLLPFKSEARMLEISFTGEFSFRICRQWGFVVSNKTKYNSKENCTFYMKAEDKTKTLKEPLLTRSGWTKEYIRIEIGPVSANACPLVTTHEGLHRCTNRSTCLSYEICPYDPCPVCLEKEDTILKLSCGYIHGGFQEGCVITIIGPDNINIAEYVWDLKVTQLSHVYDLRYKVITVFISQLSSELKHISTSYFINCFLARCLFRSIVGVNLRLTGQHDVDVVVKFQLTKIVFPSTETNFTANDTPCDVYNGHCYAFLKHVSPSSWEHARRNCEQEGGYLVSINTVEELNFVSANLQKNGIVSGLVFIGLNDLLKAGSHVWEDGTPLTFSKWFYPTSADIHARMLHPDRTFHIINIQPSYDTALRCVAMNQNEYRKTGNWIKVPCGNISLQLDLHSICEVEMTRATIPAQSSPNVFNESEGRWQCKPSWTYINGMCLTVRDSELQPCDTMAHIEKKTENAVLDFLLTVGFGEQFANFKIRTGCIELKRDDKYQVQLFKSLGCSSKFALCQSDPTPIQRRCGSQQYMCRDKTCLNPDRVCDKYADCSGGEDETQCDFLRSIYRCDDGRDVSVFRYCDFRLDCKDGSDEHKCHYTNCSQSEYKCQNGQCINTDYRCDMIPDCFDDSDEAVCDRESQCSGFKCPLVGCIPTIQHMDTQADCPDGTQADELWYDYWDEEWDEYRSFSSANSDRQIKPIKFTIPYVYINCQKHGYERFYPQAKACVYDHDIYGNMRYCRKGDHLKYCNSHQCPDMFKCPGSYCVPPHKVCDGVRDCIRGEDEKFCENRTCPYQLRCGRTNQCVSQPYVCDGQVHCKSGYDDERFCDIIPSSCPVNCNCSGYNVMCTGRSLHALPVLARNVRVLDLSQNYLSLNHSAFDGLPNVAILFLQSNAIRQLNVRMFHSNKNLLLLDLSSNMIQSVPNEAFWGLSNLISLVLQGNPLGQISEGSFMGLSALPVLNLSNMLLTELPNGSFAGLDEMTSLDLSHNSIVKLHSGAVSPATKLSFLNLENNPLDDTGIDIYRNLDIRKIRTSFHFVCCYVSPVVTDCSPRLDRYKSCSDLLGSITLRVIVWSFAVLTLVGNLGVILWRVKTKLTSTPIIFVMNLGISDLLMGIYLLCLGIADQRYKEIYASKDVEWRHSGLCLTIGAIATVSCEMSAFTLVCIAIDRTKRLAFPFSRRRFTVKSAVITLIFGWVVCILTSVIPFLWPSYFGDYYSRNSVCVPFNFSESLGKGWEFSLFLFVVLNTVGILLVIAMYVLVYVKVKATQASAGRDDGTDIEVARRLTIVIVTDLICVIPMAITNLMGTVGEPIDRDMAAVLTAIIFPINSALNPYLFTLSTIRSR